MSNKDFTFTLILSHSREKDKLERQVTEIIKIM